MKNAKKLLCIGVCVCLLISMFENIVVYAQGTLPSYINDVRSDYKFKPVKMGGGGYVMSVIIHPLNSNIMYCYTDVGGAYKWNPNTKQWEQLCVAPRMPSEVVNADDGYYGGAGTKRTNIYQVEALAIDPQNVNVVYLATGKYNSEGYLMKSTDGGETFKLLNLKNVGMSGNGECRTTASRIAVDPHNSNIVYFGTRSNGLLRSSDAGMSWAQVDATTFPPGTLYNKKAAGVLTVRFDDTSGVDENGNTKRIYVSIAEKGVLKSDDAGKNWTTISTAVALNLQVSKGQMYAGLEGIGISKYSDETGFTSITCNGNKSIVEMAVSPSDPNVIYAAPSGGQQFYRTIDGGKTWTSLSFAFQDNFKAPDKKWKTNPGIKFWLSIGEFVIDPNNPASLWLAEGMGVWKCSDASSINNSPVFYDTSDGIEELVGVDVLAAPNNRNIFIGWDKVGMSYDGPMDRAPDGQLDLTQSFSSGTSIATSGKNPNFLVVSAADQRNIGWNNTYSGYSENGGESWKLFGSIVSNPDDQFQSATNTPSELKYGEIAVSASNTSNMVWIPRCGTVAAYYTEDKGATWSKASIPAGFDYWTANYYVANRVLAADKEQDGVFYLYSKSGTSVLKSIDGGKSFVAASGILPSGIGQGKLKTTPGKAGHLWFATGYGATSHSANGLYTSTDGGGSFTQVPNVEECWSIGFGKAKQSGGYPAIYMYGKISGQWGIFRSNDQAATWDLCVEYPLGLLDIIDAVDGDMNIYGKVLMAFNGNGFAYGYDETAWVAPTTDPNWTPTPEPTASPVPIQIGENMILNPGFEDGLNGWGTNANLSVDATEKFSGNNSLKVSGATGFTTVINKSVAVEPNTEYELRFVHKGSAISQFDFGTNNKPAIGATAGWRPEVCYYKTGESETSLQIKFATNTGNTYYLDDFRLIKNVNQLPEDYTTDISKNLIGTNANFEKGKPTSFFDYAGKSSLSTSSPFEGLQCLALTSPASYSMFGVSTSAGVDLNTIYELTFFYKGTNNISVRYKIGAGAEYTFQVGVYPATAWTKRSYLINSGADSGNLKINMYLNDSNVTTDYFDAMSLKKVNISTVDLSTASPSSTPTATPTASSSPTPTVTPTASPSPTPTVTPTASPSPTPTVTPTASPSPTPTVTPTASPSPTPTVTPTASPSPTPAVTPTASPSPTPTVTPTLGPTASSTATPTLKPTASPTAMWITTPNVKPVEVKTVVLKNIKPAKITIKTNGISGVSTAGATIKLYLGAKLIKSVKADKKGRFSIKKINLKKYKGKRLTLKAIKNGYKAASKGGLVIRR